MATHPLSGFCESDIFAESLLMTFQTAMIGADGLVVASDKLSVHFQPPFENEPASTQTTSAFKFIKNADETVICSYAGGPYSEAMARAIATKSRPGDVSDLNSWKDHVLNTLDVPTASGGLDEIIVVRPQIPDCVLVTKHSAYPPIAASVNDRICTGTNAASRFLIHHFWQRLPVENLKRLALLTVAFASLEKKGMVGGGVDLLLVRDNKPYWEHYAEDDETVARSVTELKSVIAENLFRFTR